MSCSPNKGVTKKWAGKLALASMRPTESSMKRFAVFRKLELREQRD
jgi:hypothetical protein